MEINWLVDQPRVDLQKRTVLKSICAHIEQSSYFYNHSFPVEHSIGFTGDQHLHV